MKKKILAVLLSCLMVVALAACSGGGTSSSTSTGASGSDSTSTPAPSGDKTQIVFAAQGDSTPATQAVLDAFNDSQDQYEAVWEDMTNDSGAMNEQLKTSLKAGSSDYDVLSLDVVWAGEYAAAGYIDPIDDYMMDAGLSASQFNPGSMASGNYSAKQYTLPFFPDVGFLYFRSDIVSAEDAAKLASGDYTYDDLMTMMAAYKGQEGTTDGYAFQAAQYEGLVCNANEFTANWEDLQAGLEKMKEFTDSDNTPADILNYREDQTVNSFTNGETVFARNWPYMWGTIADGSITEDQVDVAPLPNGGTVGGWLLAMNKNSENKEGAWALMEFIATNDGQKIMSTEGGYLPGFNETLDDADVIAGNPLLSKEGFQNALNSTIPRPVSGDYTKVSDDIQQAVHSYLSGGADIDATVTAVQAALDAA